MRRVLVAGALALACSIVLVAVWDWELAIIAGWDLGAALFLASSWWMIVSANALQTEHLATREDETRRTAVAILLGASVASLVAVGFTLNAAGREDGGVRLGLIIAAMVTVMLSWTVVNTVFTLHYANLYYSGPGGVDFGSADPDERADYRDFAYLAFTIGMCYQVSDTTLRDRRIRRTVLVHAVLSYLFGVVIIAAGINLVAGLIQ